MGGVRMLAFAWFMVLQAASQDVSKAFSHPGREERSNPFPLLIASQTASQDASQVVPYAMPLEWRSNPFGPFMASQPARPDASQMFSYPVPEDGPSSPPMQAECRFSDGKTITVDYSTRHLKAYPLPYSTRWHPLQSVGWVTVFDDINLVTDETLVTAKGMSVPPGKYTVAVPGHTWGIVFPDLVIKEREGGELRVPMSASDLASPAESSAVSFEHTGGRCMMHVNSKNWDTQLSVEFTEENADLPVAH